jgi:archaellum component FlaC|tara:strand:- start:1553 stop:1753 length:201 start_codon:yes stop_codon:yes gene_type:complete
MKIKELKNQIELLKNELETYKTLYRVACSQIDNLKEENETLLFKCSDLNTIIRKQRIEETKKILNK